MTQPIEINPDWSDKIKAIVEKFNKSAQRRSLNGVSEALQSLINYMNQDMGRIRKEAAEALSNIRMFNSHLFIESTNQAIDQALAENSSQTPLDQGSFAEYLSSIAPKESKFIIKKPEYTEPKPDYSEIDSYLEKFTDEPKELKVNESEIQSIEEENKSFDQGGDMDALLSLSIEDLKLKNIKKVEMQEDFLKRKCALGDGEMKDYDGPLYQCACGTLYHETCLKIQAIYTGKCAICDKIYRKPQSHEDDQAE